MSKKNLNKTSIENILKEEKVYTKFRKLTEDVSGNIGSVLEINDNRLQEIVDYAKSWVGKITYTIHDVKYETNLIAEHDVEVRNYFIYIGIIFGVFLVALVFVIIKKKTF